MSSNNFYSKAFYELKLEPGFNWYPDILVYGLQNFQQVLYTFNRFICWSACALNICENALKIDYYKNFAWWWTTKINRKDPCTCTFTQGVYALAHVSVNTCVSTPSVCLSEHWSSPTATPTLILIWNFQLCWTMLVNGEEIKAPEIFQMVHVSPYWLNWRRGCKLWFAGCG